MPKTIVLIPARMESSRLPGKPLKKLCGLEMIIHVALRCSGHQGLDRVIVCTDSLEILWVCERYGVEVCLTQSNHQNGTERIAEAARTLLLEPSDIIIDVQGDEPFVQPEYIDEVVSFMKASDYSCVVPHQLIDEPNNINRVKIAAINDRILFMSRADIPHNFGSPTRKLKKHLSIIGFRNSGLQLYANSTPTPIETLERIELMRLIEAGVPIGTFLQNGSSISVDTVADYELACRIMERDELFNQIKTTELKNVQI